LREARVLIEGWRVEYNHFRPHSSLGYTPPAEYAKALNINHYQLPAT
jgi:putative transposase